MEEFLNNLYSNSSTPLFSALILGLMTAISPCPLATNITAMGFISRNIENKNKVFLNGLIYTIGRTIAYFTLALILYLGADHFKISSIFQRYGEKFIGPILFVIGLFLLGLISLNFSFLDGIKSKFQNKKSHSSLDVLFIGIIFALAFCPYSGVLFFGMLVPLTIQSNEALLLPIIFAIATALPVVIFSWLLSYTVSGVANLYNNLKSFEIWFRKIVGVLFLFVGSYYIYEVLI